jgi:hypothetical protein
MLKRRRAVAETMPMKTHASMPIPIFSKAAIVTSVDVFETVVADRLELCADTVVFLTQQRKM